MRTLLLWGEHGKAKKQERNTPERANRSVAEDHLT